ncbi:MAG: hypothetical protein F6K09_08820 [Merismopedia sp. SIO2A8]|nr:hypothetical protein [Merismopedia sp. SIO2A8]
MIKPINPMQSPTQSLMRYFVLRGMSASVCISASCLTIASPSWAQTTSSAPPTTSQKSVVSDSVVSDSVVLDSVPQANLQFASSTPAPSSAFSDSETALTQRLAQRVVDRLPPPPPIPDLQQPAPLPSSALGSGPAIQEDSSGELYMVYVNGDSPLLLEQVQQVEPAATIQPYEGQNVILVGMFDGPNTANAQVESLDQRGIQADVVSVSSVVLTPSADVQSRAALAELPPADAVRSSSSTPTVSVAPPSTTRSVPSSSGITTPPPSRSSASSSSASSANSGSAYYVVIPGRTSSLRELREQVILLGALPGAVEERDRPLGPHLLIGPFVDQSAATRWNRFFQEFGMDARVYYKR